MFSASVLVYIGQVFEKAYTKLSTNTEINAAANVRDQRSVETTENYLRACAYDLSCVDRGLRVAHNVAYKSAQPSSDQGLYVQ
jgi:hypothetical protein